MMQVDLLKIEARFTNWLVRLGPVGFVLAYSLTIFGITFLLWNLTIACTKAGLYWYWHGPIAHEFWVFPAIYFAMVLGAISKWSKIRRRDDITA
jgi:hypothetical protein